MAGNKIEYTFTGNTQDLKNAIQSAISMLERYKAAVGSTAKTNTLTGSLKNISNVVQTMQQRFDKFSLTVANTANTKSLNTFQQRLKSVESTISQVTDKYKNMGNIGFSQAEPQLKAFNATLTKIDQLMEKLTKNNDISAQQMGAYSTNLKKLNDELQKNSSALINAMDKTSLWRQALGRIQGAAETVGNHFREMFKPFTQQAQNFSNTLDTRVSRAFNSLIQKFKDLKSQGTPAAGQTASAFSQLASGINGAIQPLQRLIYKMQNYNLVQREIAKNQAKHQASLERIANYSGRGRKPKEVPELSEDEIIDQLMSSGKGSSLASTIVPKVLSAARTLSRISSTIFSSLRGVGQGIASTFGTLGTIIKNTASSFGTLATKANVATAGLRGLYGIIQSLPSVLNVIVSQILQLNFSNFLSEAIKGSIELVENLNLFTVAMGTAADEAREFVDSMSVMYGMNPSNLYRYAGYFAQITGAIGLTDKAAEMLSTSMTKMANDIASLYNVEIEQVVTNLGSGLQGLNQSVRKYGIDVRQSTIQQTAFQYGLTQNVAKMSEANRIVLRYLTIMNQMRNATKQVTRELDGSSRIIGDFARNIETPANQLRILKEQIQQLAIAIGTFFIPAVQKLLPILNGIIMAIRSILQFFAALFGIDASQWGGEISAGADLGADSLDEVGDAADSAKKKVKELTLAFDELHVFNEQNNGSGSGGGGALDWGELDPKLLKALEDLQLALDEIRMKAQDVRDAILAIFGLTPDLEIIPGSFIDQLLNAWNLGDWMEVGRIIADFFNLGIDWALENITWDKLKDKIIEILDIITGIFNGFVEQFNWEGFGHIGANIINIIFHTMQETIARIDWAALGYQMAQAINGLALNIEWDVIFGTIADGLNASFLWLLGFVTGIRWEEIAQKIVDGINVGISRFEPELLGEALARFVIGGVNALGIFIDRLDLSALVDKLFAAMSRFILRVAGRFEGAEGENIWYKFGNILSTGLMKAIQAFVDAIHTWGDMGITDALFSFLEGAIAGIDPELLRTAIDDVLNGIIGFFVRFRERFNVYELTRAFVLWLGEVFQGIHVDDFISAITGLMSDIMQGIVDAFKLQKDTGTGNLIHQFLEMVENMFRRFPWGDIGYVMGNWVGELVAHLISFFTSTSFAEFVAGFIRGIIDAFQQHPEEWTVLGTVIATFFIALINGIPVQLAAPLAVLVGWAFGVVQDFFSNLFSSIGQWVEGFFTNLGGLIVGGIGAIVSLFSRELGDQLSAQGDALKIKGKEMMDHAFDGVVTSINTNGPSLATNFSPHAQAMVDEADKRFGELANVTQRHFNTISEVSYQSLARMNSYISSHLDEMTRDTNEKLTLLMADVTGNWHQLEIDTETSWKDITTTISAEMAQSSQEVDARTNEIKNFMIDRLQVAIDTIDGLEWEATGMNGIAKLKGGIETEWGNLDVFIDTATGQVIAAVENMLDNPSYSIKGKSLVDLFDNVFSTISINAANMWNTIQGYINQGMSGIEALKQAGDESSKLWNRISENSAAAQAALKNQQNIQNSVMYTGTKTTTNSSTAKSATTSYSAIKTPLQISSQFTSATAALKSGKYVSVGGGSYRNPDGSIGKTWSTMAQKFMAKGGVVTGPTNAVIGEGHYSEAVLPLDNSPQMRQLVQSIADAVDIGSQKNNTSGQPIDLTVKVQIGDTEWDTFVYESAKRGEKNIGGNPVEVTS